MMHSKIKSLSLEDEEIEAKKFLVEDVLALIEKDYDFEGKN